MGEGVKAMTASTTLRMRALWRKSPAVKRVVMKSIPDETTRLAGLKHGEFDIAYSIRGELAEELQHTPGLSLQSTVGQATNWICFPEQWDAKSPWHDLRVRQAANLALDRDQMNQALFLGSCKVNNSITSAWNAARPIEFFYSIKKEGTLRFFQA